MGADMGAAESGGSGGGGAVGGEEKVARQGAVRAETGACMAEGGVHTYVRSVEAVESGGALAAAEAVGQSVARPAVGAAAAGR